LQLPRNSQPHPITAADIILNLKNPVNGDRIDSIHLPIPTRWYFPDDPAIDLAVLPFATPDKYDAEALPMNNEFCPCADSTDKGSVVRMTNLDKFERQVIAVF
jgi:hypothetical protein